MNRANPIILVDDDSDDHDLFVEACREIGVTNEIIWIDSASEFLEYLDKAALSPFLIVSDFNLPAINGLALRKTVMKDPYLRYRTVPYVIWTTSPNEVQVRDAYDHMVQGFFKKPGNFEELVNLLRTLFAYWKISLHPAKG